MINGGTLHMFSNLLQTNPLDGCNIFRRTIFIDNELHMMQIYAYIRVTEL